MGANEDLGLPHQSRMQNLIFAFDVDGTLIDEEGNAYSRIMDTLRTVSKWKNVRVVVWSGGGKQYAEMIGRRFELDKYVWRYASKTEFQQIREHGFVIAVDDIQDTAIGNANAIVRNK